jgi:hypothetical protein
MSSAMDSLTTYFSYKDRASGQGHEKPFYYYLQLLTWNHGQNFWQPDTLPPRPTGRFLWTEIVILAFTLVGMVRAFVGQGKGYHREFGLFLTGYVILTFGAYSLISYKTPWCILSTHFAIILLAGFGVAGFMNSLYGAPGKMIFSSLVLAGAAHLALQSYRANFANDVTKPIWLRTLDTHSSMDNPYAYGFTPISLRDTIVSHLEGYAKRSPAGYGLKVDIATPSGGWPLPWYLRKFTNVTYLPSVTAVNNYRAVDAAADIILVEPALKTKLPENVLGKEFDGGKTHVREVFGMLNQQFWIQGYIQRGLTDQPAQAPEIALEKPAAKQKQDAGNQPSTEDKPQPEPPDPTPDLPAVPALERPVVE